MLLPFWIALQFLSSLPIRLPGMPQPQELGRSLLFYPLVGLLFGVLLWGLNQVLQGTPLLLHAALLLTAWVLLSGACTWTGWPTAPMPGWAVLATGSAPSAS